MRRTGIILIICGALVLAGAVAWSTLAVPRLVKFPLSTDTTLHYSGHFVTYVNAKTGATLATPTSAPLMVDRTIKAVPSASTSSVAIVDENIVLHYSGSTVKETNVYALDRRSMCNVPNTHACTFAPGNPYPAAGSYYVTLPMNIKPGVTPLNIWKPETGTTYPLVELRTSSQPSSIDGLNVAWFSGVLPMTPVASYERTALAARGLPMSLAPSQVEEEMAADGVSVTALSAALTPVLSPAELSEVAAVLRTSVPLYYYAFGAGLVAAETRTGVIISLKNVIDGIAVAPSTTGLQTLVTVLSHHTSVKGVPAALTALRRMAAAPPQPVYELQYTETPASVANMVSTAKSQLRQISIVTDDVPIALVVIGLLLVIAGVARRLRRRTPPASSQVAGETHPTAGFDALSAGRRVA
jgi:hypothetical protein